MITTSGRGLVVALILFAISILCLVLTIRQYRQKGPVMSASFLAATREEQEQMRTKKAYHYAANVFFYGMLTSFSFGMSFLLENIGSAFVGSVLLFSGALSSLIFLSAYK